MKKNYRFIFGAHTEFKWFFSDGDAIDAATEWANNWLLLLDSKETLIVKKWERTNWVTIIEICLGYI